MDDLLLHGSTAEAIDRVTNRKPHALGLFGEDGMGKKNLAQNLAVKFLGVKTIENHAYTMILDCELTGINETREAIKFLARKVPGMQKYRRCLIFLSFHKANSEVQNALLKSLEEPPEDTIIIITANSKERLLPTTVSRLFWVNVLPVSLDEAQNYFKNEYDDEQIRKVHMLSGGKPAMMSELLEDYDNHPLVKAIDTAKKVVESDRFERIRLAESLSKDKEFDINLHLAALSKILESAMKTRIYNGGKVDYSLLNKLKLVSQSESLVKYNVSQKLILTNIFYNL